MTTIVLSINTIVSNPDIKAGRPIIAGTTLRVSDLIASHLYRGLSAEELALQFKLTLGQAYAVLAYYYTHQADIDDEIRQNSEEAEKLIAVLEQQGKVLRVE